MWHVSSRSGVATLRIAIRLLLTYLSVMLSAAPNGMLIGPAAFAQHTLTTNRNTGAHTDTYTHTHTHTHTRRPRYVCNNRPHLAKQHIVVVVAQARPASRLDPHTTPISIVIHATTVIAEFGWRRGVVVSGVHRMNKVNPRWARLVLGWVTVFGRVYRLCM